MNQNNSWNVLFRKIPISTVQNPVYSFLALFAFAATAAALLPFMFGAQLWRHQPFHSSLEASGALIEFFLALLIHVQYRKDRNNLIFIPMASALIAMGILDWFHAFSHLGLDLYWTRALRAFFGGFLFASVWLPRSNFKSKAIQNLPWITGVVALLTGFIFLTLPQKSSISYEENPVIRFLIFTLIAIGTIGFFAAAIFFAIRYQHQTAKNAAEARTYRVFANFCFLMALATSVSVLSELWGALWWYFHFLRFSAYIAALHFLTSTFRQAIDSVVQSKQDLEDKVRSRSIQLALANENLRLEVFDHRLSEKKIQQIRSQLEATLEAMNDGVLAFDMNENIVFINRSEARIHKTTQAELRKKKIQSYIEKFEVYELNGQPVPVDQLPSSKILRGESLKNWTLRVRSRGSTKDEYFEFSGEPVMNESGKQVFSVLVTKEVTELILADKALKDSELRFRQMANFLPHLIWEADLNGTFTYFNQRWYEFTGFTETSDSNNENWLSIIHPDDIQPYQDHWAGAFQNKKNFQLECRLRSANGQYYWHLVQALPFRDSQGRITKWIGTSTNMHDQKLLLEKIKKNEENLTLITTTTGIGTWDWDLRSNQVQISALHGQMLGLPSGTTVVEISILFSKVLPEDLAAVEKTLHDSLVNKTDISIEIRVKHDNDSIRWLMIRGRIVVNDLGTPVRIYGVSLDITNSKEIEEQLKIAVKQSEVASQLKSSFLANMSHEIRTPLGAILGFTDLLKEPDLSQEEKNYFFEVISRNGEQLLTLINDILDLSKVEAGQFKFEIIKSDFRKILQDVVSINEPNAQQKNLQLDYHIEDDFPDCIGTDPIRLKQILTNIIGNAIKFTEKGFVHVHALKDKHGQIRIHVQDSGIGLTSQEKEKLFLPFSQADQTTTRKFGGTGLGLVLSKKLARALGGDLIILTTQPGVGSIFEIKIEDHKLSSDNEKYTQIYDGNPSDLSKATKTSFLN